MKTLITATVLGLVFAGPVVAFSTAADAASSQPVEERKAQESLPMASGTVWNTLLQSKITYRSKAPYITAKLTPDIKALSGRSVQVDGFMLPIDGDGGSSRHFLLSKRTPTCPFCPPGEPNEVIEVTAVKPVPYNDEMLTMQGTFKLINNTDNGVFFTMTGAKMLRQHKVSYGPATPPKASGISALLP